MSLLEAAMALLIFAGLLSWAAWRSSGARNSPGSMLFGWLTAAIACWVVFLAIVIAVRP